MQPILLEHGTFKAIVYRIRRVNLPLFQLLSNELLIGWQTLSEQVKAAALSLPDISEAELEQFIVSRWVEQNWGTMQAIAQLIPTASVFPFDLEAVRSDLNTLVWLFLSQSPRKDEDGNLIPVPGRLLELQMVKPRPQVIEVDEETGRPIAQLPFPSCGDYETDTIFNLIHAFGGDIAHAKLAYEWLDQQTLEDGIGILNELQRDPDDRMREHLVRSFNKTIEEDEGLADRLNESMGLSPFSRSKTQITNNGRNTDAT